MELVKRYKILRWEYWQQQRREFGDIAYNPYPPEPWTESDIRVIEILQRNYDKLKEMVRQWFQRDWESIYYDESLRGSNWDRARFWRQKFAEFASVVSGNFELVFEIIPKRPTWWAYRLERDIQDNNIRFDTYDGDAYQLLFSEGVIYFYVKEVQK